MMKDHLTKINWSGIVKKNVKCYKCRSNFTSKMSLCQHMFVTHISTRIEETRMFCNICGEVFLTELEMTKYLQEPMKVSKTV